MNEPVTGTARLRLFKGSATLIGRSAPRSLYRTDIVTFEDDRGAYDPLTGQLVLDFDVNSLRDDVVRVLKHSGRENEHRRASGREEISEESVRANVEAGERWRRQEAARYAAEEEGRAQ